MELDDDIDESRIWFLYKDTRCEELEKILQNSPKFKDCMVRRQKQPEYLQEQGDPFEVQDAKGEHIVWIYANEANILDDTDIALYASAQYTHEQESEIYSKWGLPTMFITSVSFLGIIISIGYFISSSPLAAPLFLLSSIALSCGVIFLHYLGKVNAKKKIQIDLRYISEYPFYLDILRKLASMTDPEIYPDQEYTKRLKVVEDILSGYDV